jgi:hypothetical protein
MYIDPASGGLIFQVLLVMFGVISGAVLIFSSKIKMGISKMRRSIREKYRKEAPSQPEIDD